MTIPDFPHPHDDPIIRKAFEPTSACNIILLSSEPNEIQKQLVLSSKAVFLIKNDKQQYAVGFLDNYNQYKQEIIEPDKYKGLIDKIKPNNFNNDVCYDPELWEDINNIISSHEGQQPNFITCGLGWHIFRNGNEVIAFQYGQNPNTRSFMAINMNDRKAVAFFTNSENGMSIANQLLTSPDLAPIGNIQTLFSHMKYHQSNEPGWQDTIEGMIAEDQGNIEEARHHFANALALSPNDQSKQRRLEWFNVAHPHTPEVTTFTQPLETFVGRLTNRYNDMIDVYISDGGLICEQSSHAIKLVRISETEFVPEKDQSFKMSFNGEQISILDIDGREKRLSKQPLPKSQAQTSSSAADENLSKPAQPLAATTAKPIGENSSSVKPPSSTTKVLRVSSGPSVGSESTQIEIQHTYRSQK